MMLLLSLLAIVAAAQSTVPSAVASSSSSISSSSSSSSVSSAASSTLASSSSAALSSSSSPSSSASASASSTSSTWDKGVPIDVAIAGNYSGVLRPQIHFSPPTQWMNDPNGCFLDDEGLWHLYYQYNPTGLVAANQHWGHATSKDLYHWENQKIAIFPRSAEEQIYSGSAVIDVNNTSGFFPNQTNGVVAIYTLNNATQQTQDIAYSSDGGYTFTTYENNPVLTANSSQFRDPYVIWFSDPPTGQSHWVLVVSYATEMTIGFFTSNNLKDWTHVSNFTHYGLQGIQYECPNLRPIPMTGTDEVMYILAISINPGAPLGGSIQQYFPGHFNGTHFTAVDDAARIADFAKDNYAGQYFFGIDGTQEQITINWASNWEYAQDVPTGPLEGWRSSMSLPRKTHLANVSGIGYDLISYPYDLKPIYTNQIARNDSLGNTTIIVSYENVTSGAVYFAANVTGLTSENAQGSLNFTFSASSTNETISGGLFLGGDNAFWLDRGETYGFSNPFFTDKFSTAVPENPDGVFTIEGVIDRSILEVFLNGGQQSATVTFFSNGRMESLTIGAEGIGAGANVQVQVWALGSAWEQQAESNGTVVGNMTRPDTTSSAGMGATGTGSSTSLSPSTTTRSGAERPVRQGMSLMMTVLVGLGIVL